MSMISEVLRSVIKSRPILIVLVLFFVGCLLGWWVVGYVIWPVQYVGESPPRDLMQTDRDHYLTMVADSYSINRDLALATTRLRSWTPEEQADMLAELAEIHEQSGRVKEAQNVRSLLLDLGLAPVGTEVAVETPVAAVTPSEVAPATPLITGRPQPSLLARLLPICGIVVIVILIIAGAGLGFSMVRRQAAAPGRAAVLEARRPPTYWEAGAQPPLGNFITTYMLGDDHYDESFSIETPMGEFLGECGVGISETIGVGGSPDKVTAFEVWLFDKSDIRTVTKVLMSEHAYHDDTLRAKLASKGEAVLATPGQVITLETAALLVKAEVTEMVYGSDDLPPQSHFAKLTIELVATAKSPGEAEQGEAP
jgi:hypothetical protein